MVKILLAGGGTAGHLNPALAIAEIIKKHNPDAEFLFAGTPGSMEERLLSKTDYAFAPIKVKGFQRKISIKNIGRNIKAGAYLVSSGPRAKKIISDFKPDLVIGTGGYVSGPIVMKAAQMNIPTVIHEQNAYPGVTTKILSKKVNEVMLTVSEALQYLEKDITYTITGLPVRSAMSKKTKEEARKELGFDDSFCILSFGGSLGAGKINEVGADLIEWHSEKKNINHIHGYGGMGKDTFVKTLIERGVNINSPRLRVSEYIDNMATCMAAADVIICRSGASTLSEIQAVGRASVLIPSPVVAGNHQYHNAMVLGNAGAAFVYEQKDLENSDDIIEKIEYLYENPEELKRMAENASTLSVKDTNDRIYEVLCRNCSALSSK